MEREAYDFAVYEGQEGHLIISSDYQCEECKLSIHPDQIPMLIKWIKEVETEMKASKIK